MAVEGTNARGQFWAFAIVGFLVFVSIVSYRMNEYYIYLVAYLWFGFIYGMTLQYGRFCFASAFRDLFAVKVPRMAVGIMIALVLFAITAAFVNVTGQSTFHPAPLGSFMIIAGFIFGMGTVFAGGCASGSLYKTGEGNGTTMLVVLSISVTQAIFVDIAGITNKLVPRSWTESAAAKGLPASISPTDGWMDQYLAGYVWDKPVTTAARGLGLPDYSFLGAFGGNFFLGTVVPATLVLALIYIWLRKSFLKEKIKAGEKITFKDHLSAFWGMIMASKRTAIAGIILGIANGLHSFVMKGLQIKFGVQNFGELMQRMDMTFGLSAKGTVFDPGYWYVTTQEAQWVGWVFQKLGWENLDNIFFGWNNGIPNPLLNPADWMSVALIGGAAVMALLHNEFKWKKPTVELAFWAILGGFFMGIGSRLGLGCNVGAFFIRVPYGNYTGWLFGLGMAVGAYIGVKIFNWYTERKMAKELEAFNI